MSARAPRVPWPVPRDDRTGRDVELQGGRQGRRRSWGGPVLAAAHRLDHGLNLAQGQGGGGQNGGVIGHTDGVAQLRRQGRPRGVAIAAV